MIDRLKEIRHLIWLKGAQIKQLKREIKDLQNEANMIIGYKNIEQQNNKTKRLK